MFGEKRIICLRRKQSSIPTLPIPPSACLTRLSTMPFICGLYSSADCITHGRASIYHMEALVMIQGGRKVFFQIGCNPTQRQVSVISVAIWPPEENTCSILIPENDISHRASQKLTLSFLARFSKLQRQ